MRRLRILLSSSNRFIERERSAMIAACEAAARTLSKRHRDVQIESIWWEDPEAGGPLEAGTDPQDSINRKRAHPRDCDLVVAVFGERFGTPPGEGYVREDGELYRSGTEFEVAEALLAHEDFGHPRVVVYRRMDLEPLHAEDPSYRERSDQRRLVADFFARFVQPNKDPRGVVNYQRAEDFEKRIGNDILGLLRELLDSQLPTRQQFSVALFSRAAGPHGSMWSERHHCLGRGRQFAELDRVWSKPDQRIVSICATRGIGKSLLARAWVAHTIKRRLVPAARVFGYAFNNPNEESSPDFMLEQLAEAIGVEFTGRDDTSRRVELIAERLSSETWLLVLDGLESLYLPPTKRIDHPGVNLLLDRLSASGAGLVVLTATEHPDDVHIDTPLELRNFPPPLGARLLASFGISGSRRDLERASKDWGGHPLGLTHLALELRRRNSNIDSRGEIESTLDLAADLDETQRFLKLLAGRDAAMKPQLRQLMRAIALFDEPVGVEDIRVLFRPPIPGFTDTLGTLGPTGDLELFWSLIEARLITRLQDSETTGGPILPTDRLQDEHPLIRKYFYDRGFEESPDSWRRAQAVLSRRYLDGAVRPATKRAHLPALEAATRHRILSGDVRGAIDEIYLPELRKSTSTVDGGPAHLTRTGVAFNTRELGAFEGDLRILRLLFTDSSWSMVAPAVAAFCNGSWVPRLHYEVAFNFRAIGRLLDSTGLFGTSIELWDQDGDFQAAAMACGDLSLTELLMGRPRLALITAQKGVSFADKIDLPFERVRQRTNRLHAEVVTSEPDVVAATLQEIRNIVASSTDGAVMNSLWTYEALLSLGEIKELSTLVKEHETRVAGNGPGAQSNTRTVHLDRAIHAWARGHLALRAALGVDMLPSVASGSYSEALAAEAEREFTVAIAAAQEAHTVHHTPRFRQARAEARMLTGNLAGADEEIRSLHSLVRRYGMGYFAAKLQLTKYRWRVCQGKNLPTAEELDGFEIELERSAMMDLKRGLAALRAHARARHHE